MSRARLRFTGGAVLSGGEGQPRYPTLALAGAVRGTYGWLRVHAGLVLGRARCTARRSWMPARGGSPAGQSLPGRRQNSSLMRSAWQFSGAAQQGSSSSCIRITEQIHVVGFREAASRGMLV
jgi:hypothetical protein